MMSKTVHARIWVNEVMLDDRGITREEIKERLLSEAHKTASEVYPDGYTLVELEPSDAFIRGEDHMNLYIEREYKDDRPTDGLIYSIACGVLPAAGNEHE